MIQRPGSKRAGLTSLGGFDWGLMRPEPSDGDPAAQILRERRGRRMASGGPGRGGGATASGGAQRKRRWGAPIDAGTTPGQLRAVGEHNGVF
jgi:hypothetical protein